jgi:hypothetical protein
MAALSGGINEVEGLVEGPTGTALDFFSNTGNSTYGPFGPFTMTFSDSYSSEVPQSTFASPYDYKPTIYENVDSTTDAFFNSTSGFYNAPTSFVYAAPNGIVTTHHTLADEFGGINGNGTWSLFWNALAPAKFDPIGPENGWCVNFTETPVTASVAESHNGSGIGGDLVQGEQGAQLTTVVTNEGTGTAGDPAGGNANPLTVVDTLNSALTYSSASGTNWSCSASGQTVTCTNDAAGVAQGSAYPTLTLNVSVSASAPGTISNQVR